MKFEELDSDQRADIVNNRKCVTLTVERTTTGMCGVSGFPSSPILPSHVEVPPTPIALLEENAAQILVHAPEGPRGIWMRFFIMVYFNGGRIFFKDLDPKQLEVVVRFS